MLSAGRSVYGLTVNHPPIILGTSSFTAKGFSDLEFRLLASHLSTCRQN